MESLITRALELERAQRLEVVPGVWSYTVVTPATTWENYVTERGSRLVKLTIYSGAPKELIEATLQSVSTITIDDSDFSLISLPACDHFDFMAVLGPAGHEAFKIWDTDLHASTFECFPIFTTELTSDMPLEEVRSHRWRDGLQNLGRPRPKRA